MIVYEQTHDGFARDVVTNRIADVIESAFVHRLGTRTSPGEIASWRNSMQFMKNALELARTPADARVAIEYRVPLTAKRVDFILTGADERGRDTAVIVELKQWSEVERTDKDAIVRTRLGKGVRETTHPSYQAWTYAALIRDYNVAVQEGEVRLAPCAYLHNCTDGAAINDPSYAEHLARAPAFLKEDAEELAEFLARHVRRGDRTKLMYRIDSGRLRPSKSLSDELAALMTGNPSFHLVDDQKLVYETALQLAEAALSDGERRVLLVRGGPGTGKTVVAVNLLVELTRRGRVVQYVSRNAAPRAVYAAKLKGAMTKSRVDNLFKGSGGYVDVAPKTLDVMVVDEAHRLNEKSGLYKNLGENQVLETMRAGAAAVFFVDDDQRVTLKDIGDLKEIRRNAALLRAEVHELELASQFRCNGSDGYLAWLDNVLQIRTTANTDLEGSGYEFLVHESPNALRERILSLNVPGNKARMVAGYCWDWKGKKDPEIEDVTYPLHGFSARWNLDTDGSLWIMQPNSVHEIGCIHTCQGLEVEHVGVFVGADLLVRDGTIVTDATARSGQDSSIRGYKTWAKKDPEAAAVAADRVIKNTYRTLMSRGLKSCSVYSDDAETRGWFDARARDSVR